MDSNTIVNIGAQRFDRLREQDFLYIDKTRFIKVVGKWIRCDTYHTSTEIWKNIEYEYVGVFFFKPICRQKRFV